MMQRTITHTDEEKRNLRWLSDDLNRQADALDQLAAIVEAWGKAEVLDPGAALGIISRSEELRTRGRRILENPLIGHNTRASHRNDADIALSVTGGDGIAYSLMYAMKQDAQYGNDRSICGRMDVKAASIRVYASSCRVVAGIADEVREDKYTRIG